MTGTKQSSGAWRKHVPIALLATAIVCLAGCGRTATNQNSRVTNTQEQLDESTKQALETSPEVNVAFGQLAKSAPDELKPIDEAATFKTALKNARKPAADDGDPELEKMVREQSWDNVLPADVFGLRRLESEIRSHLQALKNANDEVLSAERIVAESLWQYGKAGWSRTRIENLIHNRFQDAFPEAFRRESDLLRYAALGNMPKTVDMHRGTFLWAFFVERNRAALGDEVQKWQAAPPQSLAEVSLAVHRAYTESICTEVGQALCTDLLQNPRLAMVLGADLGKIEVALRQIKTIDWSKVQTQAQTEAALAELAKIDPPPKAVRQVFADEFQKAEDFFVQHSQRLAVLEQQVSRLVQVTSVPLWQDRDYAVVGELEPAEASDTKLTSRTGRLRLRLMKKLEAQAGSQSSSSQVGREIIDLGISCEAVIRLDDKQAVQVQMINRGIGTNLAYDVNALRHALQQLNLPLGDSVNDFEVTLDPSGKGIVVEAQVNIVGLSKPLHLRLVSSQEVAITQSIVAAIRDLQTQLLDQLPLGIRLGNVALACSSVQVKQQWHDGQLLLETTIQVPKIGEVVLPLTVRLLNGQLKMSVAGSRVSSAIIEKIRSQIGGQLSTQLAFERPELQAIAGQLDKIIDVRNLHIDEPAGEIAGEFQIALPFETDLAPIVVPLRVSLDGSIHFGSGDIERWLRDLVLKKSQELKQALVREAGSITNKALSDYLKGTQLDVLGGKAVVVDAQYDAARNSYRLDVKVDAFGKTISVKRLLATSFDPKALVDRHEIVGVSLDFSEIEVEPGIETLISDQLQVTPDWLVISNTRRMPSGIAVSVAVRLPELGEVPVGDVAIGAQGLSLSIDNFKNNLFGRLTEELEKRQLTSLSFGPARVSLNRERSKLDPFEIWLKGKVELAAGIEVPFHWQVAPRVGSPEFDINSLAGPLQGALKSLLPVDTVPIERIEVITQPKIGLRFDVRLKLPVTEVVLPGVTVTTERVNLPEGFGITLPAFLPIPTGFALTQPGLEVRLREKTFAMLGSFTVGGPGVDKVLKVVGRAQVKLVGATGFSLSGTLVLADVLALATVTGVVDFQQGLITLDARTTGLLDKIVSVRQRTEIDAPGLSVHMSASLAVLGFRMVEADFLVDLKKPILRFSGKVDLLIVNASFLVEASTKLDNIRASASFELKIGSFVLAGASIDVTAARVRLVFTVLGLKLKIIAPSVTTLTPDRVLAAILSCFRFDIGAFFRALSRGEVVINLVDPGGDAGDEESASTSQSTQPGEHADKSASPSTAQNSGAEAKKVDDHQHDGNEEASVASFQKGPFRWVFRPAQALPGRYELHFESPDASSRYHIAFNEATKAHLMRDDVIVLTYSMTKQYADSLKCLNGFAHTETPVWITVDTAQKVCAVIVHPDHGSVRELKLPVEKIGDRPDGKSLVEILQHQIEGAISVGDMRVLETYVADILNEQFTVDADRGLTRHKSLTVGGKTPADTYAFDGKNEIVLCNRSGHEEKLPQSSPLFAWMATPSKRDALVAFWGGMENRPVTPLLANADHALFLVHACSQDPVRRLCLLSADGTARMIQLMDPPEAMSTYTTLEMNNRQVLSNPVWSDKDPFAEALMATLQALPADQETWVGLSLNRRKLERRRAVITSTKDDDATTWNVVLIQDADAAVYKLASDGPHLAARWHEFAKNGAAKEASASKMPEQINSRSALQAVAEILIAQEAWVESFYANPIGIMSSN